MQMSGTQVLRPPPAAPKCVSRKLDLKQTCQGSTDTPVWDMCIQRGSLNCFATPCLFLNHLRLYKVNQRLNSCIKLFRTLGQSNQNDSEFTTEKTKNKSQINLFENVCEKQQQPTILDGPSSEVNYLKFDYLL